MTKKQTYIALGTALVVLLGVIGYLGMGSSEPDVSVGPPTLEENPNITGSLTTEANRFFRVTDDGEADLLNYASKSPSNFLLFTTPANFSNVTLESMVEDLLVDDGLSGYVLGSYLPNEGGWNLTPAGNYLGARSVSSDSMARACQTYFVIKIADDHNTSNGFGASNGWDEEQRLKIAFDKAYFDTVNAGTEGCSMEEKSLSENGWNLTTLNVGAADELLGSFSVFEKVYAIWDTTVINQIDRSVDPRQTRNANQRLYIDSDSTKVNSLVDYLSGNIKSAAIFDADADYDGGKQDLWVYVGDLSEVVEVNTPPELTGYDKTVDMSSALKSVKQKAVADNSMGPIVDFLQTALTLPSGGVMFEVVDAENDEMTLVNSDVNGFEFSLSKNQIGVIGTTRLNSGLKLDQTGKKVFDLPIEVSDGSDTTAGSASITYEWVNSCTAVVNAYESHLMSSLEKMVYEEYNNNDQIFELAVNTVLESVDDTVLTTNFGSTDPNLTEEEIRAEVMKYWDILKERLRNLQFDEDYLKRPPYLPAQCGGGFSSCVDTVICTYMVDDVEDYMYGFGILLEKLAFPSQQVVQQQIMTPDATVVEIDNTTSQSQVMPTENNATIEDNNYVSASQVSTSGYNTEPIEPNSSAMTLDEFCSEKQLQDSDIEWWNGTSSISAQLEKSQTDGYKLYTIVDLGLCAEQWAISHINSGSAKVESMVVGTKYSLNPDSVYIRDFEDPSNSTSSYAKVYVVLDGDGKLGVYISLQGSRSLPSDPVEAYGYPEFVIEDGVFSYNESLKAGVSSFKY